MTSIFGEDRGDLFPSLVENACVDESRNRSSTARARKTKQAAMNENLRKMETALNCMYNEQCSYKSALANPSLASARKKPSRCEDMWWTI